MSTARSGRTMGSGRKRRSSRRSRGSSPARRNDDLPAPDGPRITNRDSTPEVRIPCSTSSPRTIWASRPKNTAASTSSSGAHPRYGARSGSPGGGHGKCSAPIPSARRRVQQPLQAHGVQHHRLPAIGDVDFGGGAVVGEQVAALPLRGDPGVGHRLQPGAQDGLVQTLGVAVLGLALVGGFPVLRQQADHRLAAGVGLLQRLLPPLAGPDTGVRVQIQEDLLGQTRLLLDQPRLDRHRLAAIPAGMAQKHPRHNSPPSAQASAHRAMIAGSPTLGGKFDLRG